MNDKRLLILNMLDEGKISSQEALELLEAIKDEKDLNNDKKQDSYQKDTSDNNAEDAEGNNDSFVKKSAQAVGSILGKLNVFMDNFQDKLSEEFENVEENFTEKSDDQSPIINESYTINEIIDSKKDFVINNPYGPINLYGHDEDNILINIDLAYKKSYENKVNNFYKYEISDEVFKLIFKNNISSDRENFKIDLDIRMPKDMINSLFTKSLNDDIKIHNIKVSELEVENVNSTVDLYNISANRINLKLLNSVYRQNNISANDLSIKALNSELKIEELKTVNAKLTNPNGSTSINSIELPCKNLSLSGFNSLVNIKNLEEDRPILFNNKSINSNERINPNLNIIKDFNIDNKDILTLNINTINGKIVIC